MSALADIKKYAGDILRGVIPACKYVKQACQRFENDFSRQEEKNFNFFFDDEKATRVIKICEMFPHVKGKLSGENLSLEMWQKFIIGNFFGWCHKSTKKRRYRICYIEVPRGNGKTALSAPLGLYMLSLDGEGGAEVYSAATTRDQARLCFDTSRVMAKKRPKFIEACGIDVRARNINQMSSNSKFEPLSAEGDTLDGLNIHFGIIDELHAHPKRDVYDVLETGIGKREQSALWCISTAGTNLSGICYEIRTYLTKVLSGVVDDPSFFGVIYTIDDDDDWTLPENWRKANPNWGISVEPEMITRLAQKAMQLPSAQNNFKTKHLNIWCQADQSWLDMTYWQKCADESLLISDFEGEKCFIGLDLASKIDIAAKVYIFVREIDGQEHYYLFSRFYLPMQAIFSGKNSQYQGWESSGKIFSTPGEVNDFDFIEQEIIDDCEKYNVIDVAYDPFQATQMAKHLDDQGIPVIQYNHTVSNMSEPMKQLEALIRSGKIHHDGCPVMTWMMSNVVCHTDVKDNIYPRKQREENKIDGAVAAIMAIGRTIFYQSQESVYETREPILL